MPPANVSEAEPLEHTIGKRFRRNKKNIVSLGFSVSFGISESDVTHGIFRKLWISSLALAQDKDQRKRKHQLLKTATITHHSRKTRCNSSNIFFDSFLEDLNHKICPRFLKKNNVRHCQPSSAKAKEYIVRFRSIPNTLL